MSISNFNLRKRLGMKLAQDDGAGNGGAGSETNLTDGAGGEGEGTETNPTEEKTFTQEEVNRMIKDRVARERRKANYLKKNLRLIKSGKKAKRQRLKSKVRL